MTGLCGVITFISQNLARGVIPLYNRVLRVGPAQAWFFCPRRTCSSLARSLEGFLHPSRLRYFTRAGLGVGLLPAGPSSTRGQSKRWSLLWLWLVLLWSLLKSPLRACFPPLLSTWSSLPPDFICAGRGLPEKESVSQSYSAHHRGTGRMAVCRLRKMDIRGRTWG